MVSVGPKCAFYKVFMLILLPLVLLPAVAHGATRVDLRSIEVVSGSLTDFVISANGHFQFYMYAEKNPHRLVIHCRPARLMVSQTTTMKEDHPSVREIRAESSETNVVRIVFDLKQQAKYSALMNGSDLRIRIVPPGLPQQASAGSPDTSTPSVVAPQIVKKQEGVELSVSTETQPTSEQEEKSKAKSTVRGPKVKMRGYVVDQFERKVVGSNGRREPSTGSSYSLSLKYRKKNKSNNSKFKMDYTISGHEYAEPYADDYMSQDFKVGYELKLSPKWTLKNVGSAGVYEYGNEYGVRPEISYDFNKQNEVSFYAGHRTRWMDSYSDRTDQDRFFGVQYKRKVFRNQAFKLGYQRNFNDSEKDRYDYVRSRYTIEYNVPWNRIARSTFRLDYSPREYQSRFIYLEPERDPELGILRHDEGWTFSITSRIALSQHFALVPRYTFQDRISNDPSVEDFSLHVSSISLRGRW